jgi:hypothetical protein
MKLALETAVTRNHVPTDDVVTPSPSERQPLDADYGFHEGTYGSGGMIPTGTGGSTDQHDNGGTRMTSGTSTLAGDDLTTSVQDAASQRLNE